MICQGFERSTLAAGLTIGYMGQEWSRVTSWAITVNLARDHGGSSGGCEK